VTQSKVLSRPCQKVKCGRARLLFFRLLVVHVVEVGRVRRVLIGIKVVKESRCDTTSRRIMCACVCVCVCVCLCAYVCVYVCCRTFSAGTQGASIVPT
jgi:hypothetical protein